MKVYVFDDKPLGSARAPFVTCGAWRSLTRQHYAANFPFRGAQVSLHLTQAPRQSHTILKDPKSYNRLKFIGLVASLPRGIGDGHDRCRAFISEDNIYYHCVICKDENGDSYDVCIHCEEKYQTCTEGHDLTKKRPSPSLACSVCQGCTPRKIQNLFHKKTVSPTKRISRISCLPKAKLIAHSGEVKGL